MLFRTPIDGSWAFISWLTCKEQLAQRRRMNVINTYKEKGDYDKNRFSQKIYLICTLRQL